MTTQSLDLNLIPKGISPRLYVSQYDKGQTWTFNIYAGNTAYTIPNGATVTIQGTKPDKTGFQYSCTASGNVVTATEQQQMTVIAGEVPAEIRITNNNEIIATLNFILVVEPAALTDETEISETDLPIIEQAIEMFPHYQEMIDEVSSDIQTLTNYVTDTGVKNLVPLTYDNVLIALKNCNVTNITYSSNKIDFTFASVDFTFYFKDGLLTKIDVDGTTPNYTVYLYVYTVNGINQNIFGDTALYSKENPTANGYTISDGTNDTNVQFMYSNDFSSSYTGCAIRLRASSTINTSVYPMIRESVITDATYQPYAKTNIELTQDDNGLTANAFANGAVNLLPNNVVSQTVNGITFIVNDDKTITANGTASESTTLTMLLRYGLTGNKKFYKNGRYKLIGAKGGSISTYYMQVVCTKSNAFYLLAEQSDIEQEFTVNGDDSSANGAYLGVNIVIMKNTVLNNAVFKPMITVADMPNSDYAHYVPYAKSNKELTDAVDNHGYELVGTYDASTVNNGNDYDSGIVSLYVDKIARRCLASSTNAVNKVVFSEFTGKNIAYILSQYSPIMPIYAMARAIHNGKYYPCQVAKPADNTAITIISLSEIPAGATISFSLEWQY